MRSFLTSAWVPSLLIVPYLFRTSSSTNMLFSILFSFRILEKWTCQKDGKLTSIFQVLHRGYNFVSIFQHLPQVNDGINLLSHINSKSLPYLASLNKTEFLTIMRKVLVFSLKEINKQNCLVFNQYWNLTRKFWAVLTSWSWWEIQTLSPKHHDAQKSTHFGRWQRSYKGQWSFLAQSQALW